MNKFFFLLTAVSFGLCGVNSSSADAQDGIVWKFKTAGIITSSPLVYDGKVYCGSDDTYLYCRNAVTGEAIWNFKADTSILSTPVISHDIIYFESGNFLYALNAKTGFEIWKFDTGSDTLAYKIDPWDYHHSSPVVDDTIVYYGCGNGIVYGIEIATGSVLLQFKTVNHSAIRSTPLIRDGILYFGDWHGRIYALDIAARDTLWTYETVIPVPYDNFGAVVTELIEYNHSLYFGSRNNTVRAVDITSGYDTWSIYDPSGSWMPGDPVIRDSILYMGGSDNHELWALNANTGERIWTYPAGQNIFSKPIVFDDFIIVSSGLSGTMSTPNPYSKGYLHLINRSTGSLKNKFMVNGNIFSSPVIEDGIIYFGSNDSTVYAIDSAYLFRPVPLLSFKDEGYIVLGEIIEDTIACISVVNSGNLSDTLQIKVTCSKTLSEGTFKLSDDYMSITPGQSGLLQVTIHPQGLEAGNYVLNVRFFSNELNWLDLTKKVSFKIPKSTLADEIGKERFILYPNPADDILNFSGMEQLIGIELYNNCGKLVLKEPISNGRHQISIGFLEQGIYLVKLISSEGEEFKKIIVL
jgi:outer membrane protein assembly factor BamB